MAGRAAGLILAEKIVLLIVWSGMVLTVMGIQDRFLAWMGNVHFRVANAHLTLLSLSTGLLWVGVTMIVAMWLGAAVEDWLTRASTFDANLKVVLARTGRALLVLAAVLVSLSIVGIDITVLGVFGGALGVGLGFGLQKIASNYVSGFIILIDRSLRIGDAINVGGLQGKVTQIRTRYTVVRGLDGIETLIPNEKLITDVVQNQSSYLTRGYAKVAVQVAYTTDIEPAMALLAQAAQGVGRVLQEPAPTPFLVGFGSDGIDLELGFWIEDAALGTAGVRSAINRNIWRLFAENGGFDPVCAARGANRRRGGAFCSAAGNNDRSFRQRTARSASNEDLPVAARARVFFRALRQNNFLLLQPLGTLQVKCVPTPLYAFIFLKFAVQANVSRPTGKLPC